MNILFVTDNLSKYCGANVNAIVKISPFLAEENDLYLLTRCNASRPVDQIKAKIFRRVDTIPFFEHEYLLSFYSQNYWNSKTKIGKIAATIAHPMYFLCYADLKFFNASITRRLFKKEIERICNDNENIDVVVAITEPYFLAEAVSNCKINAKKVIMQLDPYAGNYYRAGSKKLLDKEKKIANEMDKLFIVDYVYNYMFHEGQIEKKDANKYIPFGYPAIEKNRAQKIEGKHNKNAEINIVYIGQFYSQIRTPDFFVKLFLRLPENCIFHFAGSGVEMIPKEAIEKLGKRFIYYGRQSSDFANRMIEDADILLNVNNTITNQLASKLFEYFCSGKPIINIYHTDMCPSLKYTNRYPDCINIKDDILNERIVTAVTDFINRERSGRIDMETIKELYKENVDEYVSDLINEGLKSMQ